MTGFKLINLAKMIECISEERIKEILSSYSCHLNKDIENFLHNKSIVFAKQGLASTYLIFGSYKNECVLIGYFALATESADNDITEKN